VTANVVSKLVNSVEQQVVPGEGVIVRVLLPVVWM